MIMQNMVKFIVLTLTVSQMSCHGKILNNALIDKMMSDFKENLTQEPETPVTVKSEQPPSILSQMTNMLCQNYPTIPCGAIQLDKTLKKLLEKSISEIHSKTSPITMETTKTTQQPEVGFAAINSEDLSTFLNVREPVFKNNYEHYKTSNKKGTKHHSKHGESRRKEKKEKHIPGVKKSLYSGRKKIKKYYPHKIKHKGKNKPVFKEYDDDKLSMSVEMPDMTLTKRHQHLSYKVEPSNPPVWKIDYTKHGIPDMMFAYPGEQLKGKLMKSQNVVMDESFSGKLSRKDVMHPDLYIKKNFNRKKVDLNSDE